LSWLYQRQVYLSWLYLALLEKFEKFEKPAFRQWPWISHCIGKENCWYPGTPATWA